MCYNDTESGDNITRQYSQAWLGRKLRESKLLYFYSMRFALISVLALYFGEYSALTEDFASW